MQLTTGTHRLTGALSDGTGLTQEEIGFLVAAAAGLTVLLGLLRVVDALTDAWAMSRGRARA